MGFIKKIFGKEYDKQVVATHIKGINQVDTSFTDWNGTLYDNDIAKSDINDVIEKLMTSPKKKNIFKKIEVR